MSEPHHHHHHYHDQGEDVEGVPSRQEAGSRLNKRDSKLGLRNLFHRNRSATEAERMSTVAPRETQTRSGGLRASIASVSHWPYGLHHSHGHAQRSEVTLSGSGSPLTPTFPGPTLKDKKSASNVRGHASPRASRGSLAAWDPPTLCQVYPQAIKQARLPACTASAEAILRLHQHKGIFSIGDAFGSGSTTAADGAAPSTAGADRFDRGRRRHRRNTSGSYTGDGPLDRLPEKVLPLGKDSAAFVSDVIPGRHWVLQITATADLDHAAPASHATSLLARLPFRGQDKRQASNLLMVFENAADMESWLATLRSAIEGLGGRKKLSETGNTNIDIEASELRSQTSQRTLVVGDYGRATSHESWDERHSTSNPDINMDFADAEGTRGQSFDEAASTASVISHDGRQLDGLRDSTQRFSYLSSGQRTVLTSAGSSPACSPVRDSFASLQDSIPELTALDDQPRPRPRPNASAINDRRQSLQTMNHLLEMRLATSRPLSGSSAWNFDPSSPSSSSKRSSKRYSLARSTKSLPEEEAEPSSPPPPLPSQIRGGSRRPPPSALCLNSRPLSFVEDQPSPASPLDENGIPIDVTVETAPEAESLFSSWGLPDATKQYSDSREDWENLSPTQPVTHGSSEKRSGYLQADGSSSAIPATSVTFQDMLRSTSSIGDYPGSPTKRVDRRFSLQSQLSERSTEPGHSFLDLSDLGDHLGDLPQISSTSLSKQGSRPGPHFRSMSVAHGLGSRRSMTQLAEGPPPAPPPNRALPPIPRKSSLQVCQSAASP
ncbi:hypothetical protein QBC32DRAFT_206034 [Pseudoneurospora amorphoporcata]|uniref:PH domain-containing protein n=1 Tax=Pseudoneurospora amorphoporcata TaxID=241081 RepID=A0AAN6NZU6_9PEZI|nr:hypothetical protein QBC32DRAFT_206034 [Pseudoneurospora amorphoporcata]